MPIELPSQNFAPRIYGVGAWTNHLHFACDLVAEMKPRLLVELGVDRGESYFSFCQSAQENQTGTKCFGVDTWKGDQHAGEYDETTFAQVCSHNRAHYENFSTLLRCSFDAGLEKFSPRSIDLLHLDGLHTEAAVRHDLESWLPKIRDGGILLLHDIGVRGRAFGVWKVWDELREQGRSYAFADGPGLGVWEKPPASKLPQFLEQLFSRADQSAAAISEYYSRRARELQEAIAQQWRDGTIRDSPFAQQTIIQVFYTADGIHREDDSVYARIGHGEWKNLVIALPPEAGAAPLRIDFVSALTEIEVASIRLTSAGSCVFEATGQTGFDSIQLTGDAERRPSATTFRLQITGIDPQLYLPTLTLPKNARLALEMRLRVSVVSVPNE